MLVKGAIGNLGNTNAQYFLSADPPNLQDSWSIVIYQVSLPMFPIALGYARNTHSYTRYVNEVLTAGLKNGLCIFMFSETSYSRMIQRYSPKMLLLLYLDVPSFVWLWKRWYLLLWVGAHSCLYCNCLKTQTETHSLLQWKLPRYCKTLVVHWQI